MEERFRKQLNFLTEIDKMKGIYRQTILIDGSRQETDAEHSWHFALMALVLSEYAAGKDIDIHKVAQMALVHDLVEIYAGDTYAYDDAGNLTKQQREKEAADKLYALLPVDQGEDYRRLWEEFELAESTEALYANAIDCLQPLLNNYMTKGKSWREHDVTSAQVYRRMEKIGKGAPGIYEWIAELIEDSVCQGYLRR